MIENLNNSMYQSLNVSTTQEYFTFRTADHTSCHTYRILVAAYDTNGSSNYTTVIKTLPSLPNILSLEGSLLHSLRMVNGNVSLTLTFNVRVNII